MMDLALYTTIYPGVEPFLADWYLSLQRQKDHEFQLWIGLDTIAIEDAIDAIGADPKATWVEGDRGDSPARIRQRALGRIVEDCGAVVLVDSDDILHESRVDAARSALDSCDLAGCALRLVDRDGRYLGLDYGLPRNAGPEEVLPRNNVFGFSNSAYRCEMLRRCLPIPDNAVLVDWYLATVAWLFGSRLGFDDETRMDYRQHGANMTRVRPPFDMQQVIADTELVRKHFRMLGATPKMGARTERLAEVGRVSADVELFYREIILQSTHLDRYLDALNALNPAPLWWSSVAHPSLRQMWSP